jgi:hypothetical protein
LLHRSDSAALDEGLPAVRKRHPGGGHRFVPIHAGIRSKTAPFGGFAFDSGGKTRSILGIARRFRIALGRHE